MPINAKIIFKLNIIYAWKFSNSKSHVRCFCTFQPVFFDIIDVVFEIMFVMDIVTSYPSKDQIPQKCSN